MGQNVPKSRIVAELAHNDSVGRVKPLEKTEQVAVYFNEDPGVSIFGRAEELGWRVNGLSGFSDKLFFRPLDR